MRAKARLMQGNLLDALSDLNSAADLISEVYNSDKPEKKHEKRLDQLMRYKYADTHWEAAKKQRLKGVYSGILAERADVKHQLNYLAGAEDDITLAIKLSESNFPLYYSKRAQIKKRENGEI